MAEELKKKKLGQKVAATFMIGMTLSGLALPVVTAFADDTSSTDSDTTLVDSNDDSQALSDDSKKTDSDKDSNKDSKDDTKTEDTQATTDDNQSGDTATTDNQNQSTDTQSTDTQNQADQANTSDDTLPQTGDNSSVMAVAMMTIAAMFVGLLMFGRSKMRSEK